MAVKQPRIYFKLTPKIRKEIEKIVENRIKKHSITKEDFTELKNIVNRIAELHEENEEKLNELIEAQNKTEERMNELTKAQNKTEERMNELTKTVERTRTELFDAIKSTREDLFEAIKSTRKDLGGLSNSVSYGFENEVYRLLPNFLKTNYGIDVKEKFIRKKIRGKEINILGKGFYNGEEVIIIGEVKMKLDYRNVEDLDVFNEFDEKIEAVINEYNTNKIIKIIVTHLATDNFINKAKEKDIIVIQSFEL